MLIRFSSLSAPTKTARFISVNHVIDISRKDKNIYLGKEN